MNGSPTFSSLSISASADSRGVAGGGEDNASSAAKIVNINSLSLSLSFWTIKGDNHDEMNSKTNGSQNVGIVSCSP